MAATVVVEAEAEALVADVALVLGHVTIIDDLVRVTAAVLALGHVVAVIALVLAPLPLANARGARRVVAKTLAMFAGAIVVAKAVVVAEIAEINTLSNANSFYSSGSFSA